MKHLAYLLVAVVVFGLGATTVVASHRHRQTSDLQEKIDALSDTAVYPMLIPVLFGVEVGDLYQSYGDPRSGGRLHEGEDIMAMKGTPVISPTDAVVKRTGWYEGAGNNVYTANPGGETFVYMHLDRIGEGVVEGAVLKKGSLIGYVGNTGNASSTAPHLHFEVHNSDGVPTSAYPRLTVEATLQDKMAYLADIFEQTSDVSALAQLMVKNFRSTFVAAQAAGVPLPDPIAAILSPSSVLKSPVFGTSELRDGDIVRARGGIDVYIVKFVGEKRFKRLILSPSVFRSYGHLRWENVKEVESATLNTMVTSDLVRATEDESIFRLYPAGDTGEKRWIETEAIFERLGLDWDSVYEINNTDRDSYVTGEPLR